MKHTCEKNNPRRTIVIIIFSIVVATILAKSGAIHSLLSATKDAAYIGGFIAGMLFVSVFTAAPATITLAELAKLSSPWTVAVIGGLGALFGDFVIFRFIRDTVAEDLGYLLKMPAMERWITIFRLRSFRWLIPFLGAFIIASPLPDEIGLALMGLTKVKTLYFVPLSFVLNAAGILVIGFIARGI